MSPSTASRPSKQPLISTGSITATRLEDQARRMGVLRHRIPLYSRSILLIRRGVLFLSASLRAWSGDLFVLLFESMIDKWTERASLLARRCPSMWFLTLKERALGWNDDISVSRCSTLSYFPHHHHLKR